MLFITVLNKYLRYLEIVFKITNVVCFFAKTSPAVQSILGNPCLDDVLRVHMVVIVHYDLAESSVQLQPEFLHFSMKRIGTRFMEASRLIKTEACDIKTQRFRWLAMTLSLHAYLRARNHSFPEGSFFAACKAKCMTIEPSCFLLAVPSLSGSGRCSSL